MASAAGWFIICLGFSLVSAALTWPASRALRRRYPGFRHHGWAYLAAIAACSLALWALIPPLVGALFGRTPH